MSTDKRPKSGSRGRKKRGNGGTVRAKAVSGQALPGYPTPRSRCQVIRSMAINFRPRSAPRSSPEMAPFGTKRPLNGDIPQTRKADANARSNSLKPLIWLAVWAECRTVHPIASRFQLFRRMLCRCSSSRNPRQTGIFANFVARKAWKSLIAMALIAGITMAGITEDSAISTGPPSQSLQPPTGATK